MNRIKIGDMNRRVTLYNGSFVKDAGGGSSFVETERWNQWAQIKDTGGSADSSQAQNVNTNNYEVTVRFDGRISSKTWMIYEGQVCKYQSMNIDTEGQKRFLIIQFTKTDTWVDLS